MPPPPKIKSCTKELLERREGNVEPIRELIASKYVMTEHVSLYGKLQDGVCVGVRPVCSLVNRTTVDDFSDELKIRYLTSLSRRTQDIVIQMTIESVSCLCNT